MSLEFEDIIRTNAPALVVYLIEADIVNPPTSDELWGEIEAESQKWQECLPMDRVRHRPAIDAVRNAYKACGKDPNRYRPSSEALLRRAVKGLDLYRSLTVIDLGNLISMASGHSLGAFDADKIEGDVLRLGVGRHEEPYEGIGRGPLNIEGLPVFRDAVGGVGTPTSDNERTKLSESTTRLAITLCMYGGSEMSEEEVIALSRRLLEQYASATNIRIQRFTV